MQNLNRSTDHFHDFTSLSYWKNFQTSLIFLFPFPTLEFYISQRKKKHFFKSIESQTGRKSQRSEFDFFYFLHWPKFNSIQFVRNRETERIRFWSGLDWRLSREFRWVTNQCKSIYPRAFAWRSNFNNLVDFFSI